PPAPAPEAEVSDAPPVAPVPPAETPGTALLRAPTPPRPSTRVAPTPAAPPPPDAAIAEAVTESATPSPDAAPEAPAEPAAAPEEATTEIVTEAEKDERKTLAPLASARPLARPDRPARPAAPAAPAKTATPAKPAVPAEPAAPPAAAIADALAEALGGGAPETAGIGAAPSGPPMTRGETDALRVAVSRCWNVGSLSTEALRTSVVVAVSMQEDGKPRLETIRMISYSGGAEAAALQTFESARRAIVRCGAQGYDLPVEKYEHWRDIEMTFNPEKMRIK
ncbi:energy transducer TonB, partial [Actibacterium sp. MT2.3-13A]|uniref:energy transducer TonB n=1 Tax=Actibacterium sp. MT2.3-13A TaxID=2828332 RepID=UPI001BA48E9A